MKVNKELNVMSTKITSSVSVKKENVTDLSTENEYIYCLRCGRKLKNPENKKRGMGKICWEKSKTDNKKRLF